MKQLIVALALLALAACTQGQVTTSQQSLISSCKAYAVALSGLADFRRAGKLSDGTQKTVDDVVKVVHPICATAGKTLPDDIPSAVTTVAGATASLIQVLAGVQK